MLLMLFLSGSTGGPVSASMSCVFEAKATIYSDARTGDDFNRTAGTLGASWSTLTGLTDPNITSNGAGS